MTTEAGCIGIDSVFMLIPPVCLDVPNAFTPNSDGLNDVFLPVTICPIKEYRMLIFNRWGEKLFESNDINYGWDGKKNGTDCPGDTYVFKITYTIEKEPGVDEKFVRDGVVLLLK